MSCGTASWRFSDVYAVSGSVNSSDQRLKTDIVDLPQNLGLAFIEKLRPKNFRWIDGTRIHQGFIAQEVGTALTESGLDPSDMGLYIDGQISTNKDNIRRRQCFDDKQIICEEKYNEKRLKKYEEEQAKLKEDDEEYVIPEYVEQEPYVPPEYVPKEGNPYQLGLRYAHFVAPLVKAVQELSDIVSKQQKQINNLQNLVSTLLK
jgi:hypothetical protein